MTDLEMDLILANAEISLLKKRLAELQDIPQRCKFPDGITIKPDGVHELDPCSYAVMETHRDVTVEVLQCQKCGHIEISWYYQEDTEDGDSDG